MAVRIVGSAMTASTKRDTDEVEPAPQVAVQSPTIAPRTVPSSVAAGATMRMSRAPAITREKTSRPRRSVFSVKRLAETFACDLDRVQPRLRQWNADHLHRHLRLSARNVDRLRRGALGVRQHRY